ncbi:hypothetical protein CFC21_020524 [Triticum aestivum]|uniref:Alpha/beta hydrolase fold-3 domain-containing protein n=2 Tax=Triticum aestivum TaxID=4565 RepID=A0A1D5UF75_WHEAT|nr:probable carboxylesterase 5 [Triticum aestivum]XP_044318850.1 probable carboxylesterase 5 [Triticum aestivum]KAF7005395.1 hypothetical protein CFC21_020520 [Triticum aestivum]KAF7005399.1 hypothetical protein CFC21_020524 [Triticum aestivum]
MPANKTYPSHKNANGEVDDEFYPLIRKYKDGRIERFMSSFVPASEDPAASRGVATRDVVVDQGTGVSVRLFLPAQAAEAGARLPLVVYVHGGSFCTESAFSRTYHRYATSLAASAGALIVSVEYRLAPEYPVPTSYDDTWAALRWVASLSDPWLAKYADPSRTFLAGDSAGGNIVYHTAVRATHDDSIMDIQGLVMVHPFFWGPERLPAEKVLDGDAMFPPVWVDKLWPFVTAGGAGNDDPRINPPDEEIALLTGRRVLVAVAEKDTLRDRGRQFVCSMRRCGWVDGSLTVVESEGEDHGFHLYAPLRATSKKLMKSIVQFINHRATLPSPAMVIPEGSAETMLGVPSRPFKDIFGYGMRMKRWSGTSFGLKVGRAKASTTSYGLPLKQARTFGDPVSAPTSVRFVMRNCF